MPLFEKADSVASSKLSGLLQEFYEKEGSSAWQTTGVPFYLTSTPRLAKEWAELLFAFFVECHTKEPLYGTAQNPWMILEVGAGTGRFAYLFLLFFEELLAKSRYSNLSWKYVMLDLNASLVASWSQHPWLERFWAKGTLVSGCYDLKKSESTLLSSGQRLEKGCFRFPIGVVAGYLLNSLPFHALCTREGKTFGLGIEVAAEHFPEEVGLPLFFEQMQYTFFENEKSLALLWEWAEKGGCSQALAELILFYQNHLHQNGQLWTLATGSLDLFLRLAEMSPRGFFSLTGDQGMSSLALLQEYPDLLLGRHGSFSCPVNYHGLAFFIRSLGQRTVLSESGSHKFITCGTFWAEVAQMDLLQESVQRAFDRFDNVNYWSFVNKILARFTREEPSACESRDSLAFDLEFLELVVKLGEWDPINFFHLMPFWKRASSSLSAYEKKRWVALLLKIEERFFPICKEEALLLNELGLCLQLAEGGQEAKKIWEKAELLDPKLPSLWMNLAMVAEKEGDFERASQLFLRAESLRERASRSPSI